MLATTPVYCWRLPSVRINTQSGLPRLLIGRSRHDQQACTELFHPFNVIHLLCDAIGAAKERPVIFTNVATHSFLNSLHLINTCFSVFRNCERMPKRSSFHVSEERPRVRKWDREVREERLRRAVFTAMNESRANLVSPSDIARHARVSKALIYKHFRSVDVLIEDAIQSCLQLLNDATWEEHESQASILERAFGTAAKLHEAMQTQPELIDLIGWSMGNPHPQAVKVSVAVKDYCEGLARKIDANGKLATLFIGVFANIVCDRQLRPAGPASE